MENSTVSILSLTWYQNDIRRRLIPALIYLALIGMIGIPGNLYVVVYFKNYRTTVYRSIFMTIGIADLVFCAFGIPFNTARIVFYYDFKITWICQAFAAILDLGIILSANLLLLLTIHRFRQIFMQLKPQFTTANINRWIGASLLISIILFIPHVGGLQPLESISLAVNLTGSVCGITWKNAPLYWRIYNIFLTTLFLVYTLIFLVIYGMIGRKIVTSYSKRRSRAINFNPGVKSTRMTKIAFTVCTIFALSYLPLFFGEVFAEEIHQEEMNDIQFSFFKIYERSYLLNHVINPLIFMVMDSRFRQGLLQHLKCCKATKVDLGYDKGNVELVNVYVI